MYCLEMGDRWVCVWGGGGHFSTNLMWRVGGYLKTYVNVMYNGKEYF